MQNKGVISVLPSSQGCVLFCLSRFCRINGHYLWLKDFVRLLQHWTLLKAHQGHLGSSNPIHNYPVGMGKETTRIYSKIAECISFSGITWRDGSFGAQPQVQSYTSLGGVTPLEQFNALLCPETLQFLPIYKMKMLIITHPL